MIFIPFRHMGVLRLTEISCQVVGRTHDLLQVGHDILTNKFNVCEFILSAPRAGFPVAPYRVRFKHSGRTLYSVDGDDFYTIYEPVAATEKGLLAVRDGLLQYRFRLINMKPSEKLYRL